MGRLRTSSLALLVLLGSNAALWGAAKIQVHVGTTVVPGAQGVRDRAAPVEFGTAAVATELARTFTVKNVGDAPLQLLSAINLPPGFTEVRDFGTTVLAPGQTTHFVIALNSARAGRVGGAVWFATNDPAEPRFQFAVAGTANGPPALRIVDNADADFRTVGAWTVVAGQGFQGSQRAVPSGTGSGVATWTFRGVAPGRYQISATWAAQSNLATDAQFTIWNGTELLSAVPVNQQTAPADFRDAGTTWKNLGGLLRVTGDTLVVKLTNQANGRVAADAVRLERVRYPGRIIDNRDPAFSTTGTWRSHAAGFQGSAVVAPGGSPLKARWTFTNLVPGHYRVSATWPAAPGLATNASFTLINGAKVLGTVAVNQRQAPNDLTDAGAAWQDLGERGQLYTVHGSQLEVVLSAQGATGNVVADAIRLERIYNPGGHDPGPLDVSTYDAIRFLEQTTWGPTDELVQHVLDVGFDAFLNEQYHAPISSYPTLPLVPNTAKVGCPQGSPPNCVRDNYTTYPLKLVFYTNALYQPDQLRQRLHWAWHKILVVSSNKVGQPSHLAPYLQILSRRAFGNYRTLLHDVTLNPAMGHYLDLKDSVATATKTPNENYAREVLQLFSIGLSHLNQNGTYKLDGNGNQIPTYTQATVTNFAKALSGWHLAAQPQRGIDNYIDPMIANNANHDKSAKTLLSYANAVHHTLPANQTAAQDLSDALDNIFYHPNVAPFICRNLIQQLVTSNPDNAYVGRVAAVFNNNGAGVRGDLWAVTQAIVLDPSARGDVKTAATYGKLREPVQYVANVMRAFNALSYDQSQTSAGYLFNLNAGMGQITFDPPSVFSYFSPFKTIPNTGGVQGPEFQILDADTALHRVNFINTFTNPNGAVGSDGIKPSANDPTGTRLDFSALEAIAGDPAALVGALNDKLLHGTMSADMANSIVSAVSQVPASNPLKRAKYAVYLVATSSQYQVQR